MRCSRVNNGPFRAIIRPIPPPNLKSRSWYSSFDTRYSPIMSSLSPLGYLLIQGWRRVHANFRVICSCSHESIRGKYYFVEENRGKGFFMCSFYFFLDFYIFVRFANWKNVFWKSCPVFTPFSKIFFFFFDWVSVENEKDECKTIHIR